MHRAEEYIKLLPFYSFMNDREKSEVLRFLVVKEYKNGSIIYDGDLPCGIICIINGGVRLYAVSEEGRELVLFTAGKGECMLASVEGNADKYCFDTIRIAEGELCIVVIPGYVFYELLKDNPDVQNVVRDMQLKQLERALVKMGSVVFDSLEKRLCGALNKRYLKDGKILRITRDELAKEIGSVREVVTRKLSLYEEQGIIETGRGRIIVKEPEKLKLMAD